MAVDVWVPGDTAREYRALLPVEARLHDLPMEGSLPDRLGHADILVADFRWRRAIEAIPRLEALRVVQSFSAGVDPIVDRIPVGVTLCDAAGVHDIPVAEWVLAAILATHHRFPDYAAAQAAAHWLRSGPNSGDDLDGATVLILGYGSIGRAVEARLAPFRVEFLRVARRSRDGVSTVSDLPELLSRADVVVVLLPLTDETRGLIDAGFLAAMRPGALLVNAARGAIVDTEALLAALHSRRVTAALDVTDPEPLPDGHPLWSAPGVFITPHIAGAVPRVLGRAWSLVAEQIRRYVDGEPLRNVVVAGY